MYEEIKKSIEKFKTESLDVFTIDSYKYYNNQKIEIVLSTDYHMASISILTDFTYDFLVVDIDTENVVQNETKYYTSTSEIISKLNADLKVFLQINKK